MVILRVRTITYQAFHKHLLGILTNLEINYYSSQLASKKNTSEKSSESSQVMGPESGLEDRGFHYKV